MVRDCRVMYLSSSSSSTRYNNPNGSQAFLWTNSLFQALYVRKCKRYFNEVKRKLSHDWHNKQNIAPQPTLLRLEHVEWHLYCSVPFSRMLDDFGISYMLLLQFNQLIHFSSFHIIPCLYSNFLFFKAQSDFIKTLIYGRERNWGSSPGHETFEDSQWGW